MYNLILEPDLIVTVYVNPKDENSEIEGTAKLIRKMDSGDSFYLDHEEMYKPYTTTSSLSVKPDEFQVFLNETYEYLDSYFTDVTNSDLKKFKKDLKSKCSRKNDSYNKMYKLCESYRESYNTNTTHIINNVLNIDPKYVVRYIQQTNIKNWRPTIFMLEKWLVEFMDPNDPFFRNYTTTRWIPLILKTSPNELSKRQDLSKYTTYNGSSSLIDQYEEDE